MRRLIRFACDDAMISGSVDAGESEVGLLCVTGGSQVRSGPHRMLHHLAVAVAAAGHPVFRYERRGLGDSDGEDPGYRHSGPDLAAAAAAFRRNAPHLRTVIGFGLCDGATTLALHGRDAGIDRLILANPWLVETEAGDIAPAAARIHYRDRLLSPRAWIEVVRGRVDLLGAMRSLFGAVTTRSASSLGDEVAGKLDAYAGKLLLILATGDATAIAARACWKGSAFATLRDETIAEVQTDAHTFARQGDAAAVAEAVLRFVREIRKDV